MPLGTPVVSRGLLMLTLEDSEMTVSQDLRAAIQAAIRDGTTRYVIAKGASVDHTALSRFLVEGRDVRVSTVDRVADYLGLELRPKSGQTEV
jgi:DNA-binding phage protein